MTIFLRLLAAILALACLWQTWQALAPLLDRDRTAAALSAAPATLPLTPELEVAPWHALPVQQGRIKPLATAAGEWVRQITGQERFGGCDPVAILLAWRIGAGRAAAPGLADWEEVPLILCEYQPLRDALADGAPAHPASDPRRVAPTLLRASAAFERLLRRVAQVRGAMGDKAHFHLSTLEMKAEEVARRLVLFDALCGRQATRLRANVLSGEQFVDLEQASAQRTQSGPAWQDEFLAGLRRWPDPLRIAALDRAPDSSWLSLAEIVAADEQAAAWQALLEERARLAPRNYPAAGAAGWQPAPERELAALTVAWSEVATAFRSGEGAAFAAASERFLATIRQTSTAAASDAAPYPGVETLAWELAYHRWQPFRWAWMTMLGALVLLGVSLVRQSAWEYRCGLALYAVSLALQTAGFALRTVIAGRMPVANLYETVIFAALGAALLAIVLEAIYRGRVVAIAGAATATLGLLLADQLPLALDPTIAPIAPVLRTNFWLTVHVLTIVGSYAAGTLAWGLGNLSLGLIAFGRRNRDETKALALYTYRALQLAVLLLAAGTFLGSCWAAESWGRFWGWDPKEVGALIALVCYVIPLHGRYLGWVSDFGLALAAVLCYAAILLSWYVINFVLAAGLHNYGFSTGGSEWVLWATLVNLEFVVLAALWRHEQPDDSPDDPAPAPLPGTP